MQRKKLFSSKSCYIFVNFISNSYLLHLHVNLLFWKYLCFLQKYFKQCNYGNYFTFVLIFKKYFIKFCDLRGKRDAIAVSINNKFNNFGGLPHIIYHCQLQHLCCPLLIHHKWLVKLHLFASVKENKPNSSEKLLNNRIKTLTPPVVYSIA